MRFLLTVLALCLSTSWGDIYLHNPRGANNRLNENTATRSNNNRLFDSQNNARGGYNVGDKQDQAFTGDTATLFANTRNPGAALDTTATNPYQMFYYEHSILPIEWTDQHACGGHEGTDPNKANCNILLQYTCETDPNAPWPFNDPSMKVPVLHDGLNTGTPSAATTQGAISTQFDNNNANGRGRHESEAYYYECRTRSRNRGLFIADQNVGNNAINTRQNANGGQSGLECPEERDYYPYWSPNPWRDIAYLTDAPEVFCTPGGKLDTTKWPSLNNVNFSKCVDSAYTFTNPIVSTTTTGVTAAVTSSECTKGTWLTGFQWGLPAPECKQVEWSRANHLGNGRDTEPLTYNWTLPSLSTLASTGARIFSDANGRFAKCVLRVRYNVSTDDYDPWTTDWRYNKNNGQSGLTVPVTNDPYVDVGAELFGLTVNIDTSQFGRTFQDRSHVFWVKERPTAWASKNIYNLNVRGKRCNIVQCYPAVEYDFVPGRLHVKPDDLIHIQWTGSNTHNNGGGGGDGQAGDTGQGRTGTDRQNMAQISQTPCPAGVSYCGDRATNYPIPLDKFRDNMFSRSKCYDVVSTTTTPSVLGNSWIDCAVTLATSGFYRNRLAAAGNPSSLDVILNNGYASLKGGVIMTFGEQYADGYGPLNGTTIYDYMCTRNNALTNRSQKAAIVVDIGN